MRLTARTAAATACAGALSLLSLSAGPAIAHDEIKSQSPARGAKLKASPARIVLGFSGAPMSLGATILVVDASGKDFGKGAVAVNKGKVTRTVAKLADGLYQVRWRVVSEDGSVISGSYDFGVGDTSKAKPVPFEAQGGPDAALAPSSTYRGPTVAPAAVSNGEDRSAVGLAGASTVGAGAALLLGWGITRLRRTRRHEREEAISVG